VSRIVIIMDGGLVQNVLATNGECDVTVIDYDTDGALPDERVRAVPQVSEGKLEGIEPAFINHWCEVEEISPDLHKLLDAMYGVTS
jgi:hypothetical protein